ncbi:hypothetical protein PR048_012077 [Dryococelus australis]|uniref:Uncharacterized protein n=1 Tax=Dryococelus australis TaxID=614101 RepID=A0ABQ9HNC0_9NEOP|nr:hypothetical protein PR048_012077 [Dryococelus australis]
MLVGTIVYVDETYSHAAHSVSSCWQSDKELGITDPIGKGQQVVTVRSCLPLRALPPRRRGAVGRANHALSEDGAGRREGMLQHGGTQPPESHIHCFSNSGCHLTNQPFTFFREKSLVLAWNVGSRPLCIQEACYPSNAPTCVHDFNLSTVEASTVNLLCWKVELEKEERLLTHLPTTPHVTTIEARMEQNWNERAEEIGDHRENQSTSSIIIGHDSHMRKSGGDPARNRTQLHITYIAMHFQHHYDYNYNQKLTSKHYKEHNGAGMKGQRVGRSKRKSANEQYCLAGFPYTKIWRCRMKNSRHSVDYGWCGRMLRSAQILYDPPRVLNMASPLRWCEEIAGHRNFHWVLQVA